MTTLADWTERAAALTPRTQALIDGEFVDAVSGETFADPAPRSGRTLASVAAGDVEDIDRAVRAARRSFEAGTWSAIAPRERKAVMLRWADLIDAHREELGLIESLDVGKPISDAVDVDVVSAATTIRWYAEAIDKVYGEVAPMGPDALALITREPMGVVGAVVPWNYPLIISSWKLAPALAVGNSVVLKPAEQSPLSAIRLAELGLEAGLPAGVFNVVPGLGETAGAALGRHPLVDKLAFTGSARVGRLFQGYAAESNGKTVSLELGGKSPHIVLDDCPDIEAAGSAVAWGIFYNAGQSCNAGSRLIVDRRVRDRLLEVVERVAGDLQPGEPLDPATKMGAIVSAEQLESVLGWIDRARSDGAGVRIGGERVREESGGWFVPPTILDAVANDQAVAREEVFGPVLVTIDVDGPEEALAVANDSEYGLSAALWTADISRAHRMARALRVGTVSVNTYDATDVSLPFGGFKGSGHGRDKSLHALDSYTHLKTTWVELR